MFKKFAEEQWASHDANDGHEQKNQRCCSSFLHSKSSYYQTSIMTVPSVSLEVRMSSGARLTVELNEGLENVSVLGFKQKIAAIQEDCPPERQRLIYKGRILDDERTLSDYGVVPGATLHLVKSSAPPPAAPSPPAAPTTTQQQPPVNPFSASASGNMPPNPFGMPGGAGMPSPEQMNQMMNNPMVQSMMDNPEFMRNMMESNPQVQAMLDSNPQ